MNYTKENFIKGEFAFINDGSKELENILKDWFPEDKSNIKEYKSKFIVINKTYPDNWDTSNNFKGTTIKASEINNPKEWLGSEMEYYFEGDGWKACTSDAKFRWKQLPDHTEEIQRLAKEMNVTVKIDKI